MRPLQVLRVKSLRMTPEELDAYRAREAAREGSNVDNQRPPLKLTKPEIPEAAVLDVVLKALKSQPKKGEVVDVTEAWLKQNFVGKLGWATLYVDEYNGKKSSKITAWITNPKFDAYAKFSIVGDQQEAKAEDDFK